MKKGITIAIVLLIVAIVTMATTYAFFTASTITTPVTTQAHQLVVIYHGDTEIRGNLNLVKSNKHCFRRR